MHNANWKYLNWNGYFIDWFETLKLSINMTPELVKSAHQNNLV